MPAFLMRGQGLSQRGRLAPKLFLATCLSQMATPRHQARRGEGKDQQQELPTRQKVPQTSLPTKFRFRAIGSRFFYRISFIIYDSFHDDEPQNGQKREVNDDVFGDDEAVGECADDVDEDDESGDDAGDRRSSDSMPQLDKLTRIRVGEVVVPNHNHDGQNGNAEPDEPFGSRQRVVKERRSRSVNVQFKHRDDNRVEKDLPETRKGFVVDKKSRVAEESDNDESDDDGDEKADDDQRNVEFGPNALAHGTDGLQIIGGKADSRGERGWRRRKSIRGVRNLADLNFRKNVRKSFEILRGKGKSKSSMV